MPDTDWIRDLTYVELKAIIDELADEEDDDKFDRWEINFIESMSQITDEGELLTEKQLTRLAEIYNKL